MVNYVTHRVYHAYHVIYRKKNSSSLFDVIVIQKSMYVCGINQQ